MDPTGTDLDLEAQEILLAASQHDLEKLKKLLRTGSANVQDPDTGFTPLHAAIAACERSTPSSSNGINSGIQRFNDSNSAAENSQHENGTNGQVSTAESSGKEPGSEQQNELNAAARTVRLLLQNGAIWNDLSKDNETPGCIARRLGLSELYEIMVDAGVRAEMLLNRLDGYELLEDDDENEEEEQRNAGEESNGLDEVKNTDDPSFSTDRPIHATEISNDATTAAEIAIKEDTTRPVDEEYLKSDLTFRTDRLLDQDKNGVMMFWETDIMKKTADLLVPTAGFRILNIGHGMGIIDDFFQEKSPSSHHIVEAHPAVIAQMKKNGWHEKPGVIIHEGKWQTVIPTLIEQGLQFDAIYWDTFSEAYKDLHLFFSEYVIGLLDDGGKWGFFNGLGADRQICYDVYTKLVEIDALEMGYDVEWTTVPVPDLEKDKEWEGVKRPYWRLKEYKLPICTFIG